MVKTKEKFTKTNNKKPVKLTAEQKYWTQVETQTRYLITDILQQTLPVPDLQKKENFTPRGDNDYCSLLIAYQNNYSEVENLPASETLAEELAYEYLLLVVKSLLSKLSDFSCHLDFSELDL